MIFKSTDVLNTIIILSQFSDEHRSDDTDWLVNNLCFETVFSQVIRIECPLDVLCKLMCLCSHISWLTSKTLQINDKIWYPEFIREMKAWHLLPSFLHQMQKVCQNLAKWDTFHIVGVLVLHFLDSYHRYRT